MRRERCCHWGRWVETIALRWFRRRLPGRGCVNVLERWLTPPAGMAAVFVKWARGFFFMAGMIFLVRRWPGNQTDALG